MLQGYYRHSMDNNDVVERCHMENDPSRNV